MVVHTHFVLLDSGHVLKATDFFIFFVFIGHFLLVISHVNTMKSSGFQHAKILDFENKLS